MNRKSFYYHFKDKYDLLNWIFDTEIIAFAKKRSYTEQFDQRVERFRDICNYFYENRKFYRRALMVEGQNSFSSHFREYAMLVLRERISYYMQGEEFDDFELNFFADAALGTIERWLLDKNCMPPDEFIDRLLNIIRRGCEALHKELNQEN